MDDDGLGPRRNGNGNTNRQQQRYETVDWKQLLLDTNIDQTSYEDRVKLFARVGTWGDFKDALDKNAGNRERRNRTTLAIIAIAATLLCGFASFFGNIAANASGAHCPSGFVCVPTPAPTPSPDGGP